MLAPALPVNIRPGWKENGSNERSSLLQYRNNYGRKKF
jgi:hypothetical protein